MKRLLLLFIFGLSALVAQANNLAPVAVISPNPSGSSFYNLEDIVFTTNGSYDPDGYINYTNWYINGVYQTGGSYSRSMSVCFALDGSPAGDCYQLASGATTVQVKLEVRDNSGAWSSKTTTYTIQDHKGRKYFIKDHLGSVRTTVNRDGNVLGYDDYYPFGLTMPGRSSNSANPNDKYKFTGHEQDDEAGINLMYAGARYADLALGGRWLSIDPNAFKYPGLSPYHYAYNNPVNAYDPDGRDGILIAWKRYPSGGVPLTGHAGVLLIDNKTGLTKYYEYGRYDKPEEMGIVNHYEVPNVVIGKDGRPTAESLNNVMSAITKRSGTKNGKSYTATGAYFVNDNFDEMNKYAQSKLAENSDPNRNPYSEINNNCSDFACGVLKQGGVKGPLIEFADPFSMINQYTNRSDYRLTYKPGEGITIRSGNKTVRYNEKSGETSEAEGILERIMQLINGND